MESIPKMYETSGLNMVDMDTSLYGSGVYFVRVGNSFFKFLMAQLIFSNQMKSREILK
jgi:hypothetical protein